MYYIFIDIYIYIYIYTSELLFVSTNIVAPTAKTALRVEDSTALLSTARQCWLEALHVEHWGT